MNDRGTDEVPGTEVPQMRAAQGCEVALPIVEEEARVSKRTVTDRRVRVRTVVETFEEHVQAEIDSAEVSVTRVTVGRYVTAAPAIRTEGEVTIIPVLEEVLVVEKRLLLKEEIHIHRSVHQETIDQPVLLRRQHAVVEEDADDSLEAGK